MTAIASPPERTEMHGQAPAIRPRPGAVDRSAHTNPVTQSWHGNSRLASLAGLQRVIPVLGLKRQYEMTAGKKQNGPPLPDSPTMQGWRTTDFLIGCPHVTAGIAIHQTVYKLSDRIFRRTAKSPIAYRTSAQEQCVPDSGMRLSPGSKTEKRCDAGSGRSTLIATSSPHLSRPWRH